MFKEDSTVKIKEIGEKGKMEKDVLDINFIFIVKIEKFLFVFFFRV